MGAQFERDHKTYQNRTGRLIRSTKGRVIAASANEVRAEIVMDTEYASYVAARGYSAIDEAGVRARDAIQDAIDALSK